jgi:hypothetical protein
VAISATRWGAKVVVMFMVDFDFFGGFLAIMLPLDAPTALADTYPSAKPLGTRRDSPH